MRHLPRFLIATILMIITTAIVAKAEQVPCDNKIIGSYVAANLNPKNFSHWSVDVYKRSRKGAAFGFQFIAEVNIACGTKVIPATYELSCEEFYDNRPRMVLVNSGASQCTLAEGAELNIDVYTGELEVLSQVHVPTAPDGMDQNALGLVYRLNRIVPN